MEKWMIVLAASLSAAIVIACILCMACYRHLRRKSKSNSQETLDEARSRYYAGLKTLRETSTYPNPSHNNRVASVWRNSYSYSNHYPLRVFEWTKNPSLISEVVEYGWITFGFTKTFANSSPGNMYGIYNRFSHGDGVEPEISWEMGQGVDYMQKIRLNPGLPSKKDTNVLLPVQSVQSALPLPGPPLGALSFPQEAYFEITILAENGEYVGSLGSSRRYREDEDIQLIPQSVNSEDHFQHTNSEKTPTNFNGSYKGRVAAKKNSRGNSKGLDIGYMDTLFQLNSMDPESIPKVISLGLAVGGTALYRLPGCERGSVGFHSTGFVFLNGAAYLGNEQDQHKPAFTKRVWDAVNTVIGCGYDPVKKRVLYTLNGDQVYSLICNSDVFSHPLYPTIAANYDVTVLANFGQSQFEYLPANEQRVADPCFKRSRLNSPVKLSVLSHNEDSGDLFSMRMDSPWIGNVEYSNSQDLQLKHLPSDGESDLFEISLDNK
ncbi:hypothetical protein SUGI_0899370 [Cryptomeria japonica]|uniref:uncharacterized protein LOC131062791 n=1 Tax=Cryptomeria japonica TaxID=3369 RepID=UPI002414B765|nr:uncharacterized protein LOC131062791 [Cryptomeria japonica]GLJ43308.1 hypothetical protein SUGI_0899370 [Cryptomeria japonica]